MADFLNSSDPNEIRNVINALAARVAELELRNTQFDSADQAMNSIDDLDYRAKDSNGAVKMIMSGRNLLEEFGIDAHFAGLDANGIPQFYVSADTGAIAALGGRLLINSDGLSIDGLNLAQYFFGSNAGNERQSWLGMYLPQDGTAPVWSVIFTGPDGQTIILNGDAETGDETNWTDADSAWDASSTSPYDGSYSFKHNSSAEVFPGKLAQNIAVTADDIYSFGFASRLESGILSPYAKLVWKTSAPAVISTDTIYGTHSSSWQFSQQSFRAPATAASVDIELYPGDPFNDCYFDGLIFFAQAISTELRLSDHSINSVIDGQTYQLNPFEAVATAPDYVDNHAVLYFTDAGDLYARMKLGASEQEFLIATMRVTVNIPTSADFYMDSSLPTTNFNTNANIFIGENTNAVATYRSWIKPDFSSIPAGKTFVSATLKLVVTFDVSSNARTLYAHRCLRTVVAGQGTWNVFASGNNWGTAGASNSATDYDGAVALGSTAQPASPSIGSIISITLDKVELQKMYDGTFTNNGIILFVDTQVNDAIGYGALDNATPSNRPVIEIVYM